MIRTFGIQTTLVLFAVAGTSTASAAQITSGSLQGTVLHSVGRPAPGVEVILGAGDVPSRQSRSNRRGQFRFLNLPVGEYAVLVRAPGYRAVRYDSVVVRLGSTTSLPATVLEEGDPSLAPVVVTGERGAIDVTSATIGTVFSSRLLKSLPQERDVASVLSMVPHYNPSAYGDGLNVAGSSGYENAHYVDGAHSTDPLLGRGATTLPYNFVREIQVRIGGYEAEYGRSAGGIVDVLTHSGGNDFSLETFGYLTNNRVAGERRLGALERSVSSYSHYDAGVALGGPIRRDRAWFFLAWNPTISREHIRVPSFAPQLDERIQHLFAAKVTWLPGPSSTVQLTAHGDPAQHQRVGVGNEFIGTPAELVSLDPILGELRQGAVNGALSIVHNAGSVEWQGRLQLGNWQNRNWGRQNPGLLAVDPTNGRWSGGYGITIDESMQRTGGALYATIDRGSHLLKGGVEVQENVLDEFFAYGKPAGTGGYRFEVGPDAYQLITGGTVGQVRTRVSSLFLQDGWQARGNLRVNAGLRWDGEDFRSGSGQVVQRLRNGLQPRVGVVFDPSGDGRSKWDLSAGRFYQQIGLALASYQFAGTHTLITIHSPLRVDTSDFLDGAVIQGDAQLQGQHFDEVAAGYQRVIGSGTRIGLRFVQRRLRQAIEDAFVPADSTFAVGNPGRGILTFVPKPRRNYRAVEATVERTGHGPVEFSASYVWSRNHGNYTGAFDSDNGADLAANFGPQYDDSLMFANATGLLPNDRTHAVKVFSAWHVSRSVTVGSTATWMSGTPRTDYANIPTLPGRFELLSPRGSVGRTPSLLDVNVRLSWSAVRSPGPQPRFIIDLFHVGGRRTATLIDQQRLFKTLEGDTVVETPNPNYGRAIQFQSPMSLRVGLTVDW
jgi:hypothetical protein